MNPCREGFMCFFEWIFLLLKYIITRLWGAFPAGNNWIASPPVRDRGSFKADTEEWKTNEALLEYHLGDAAEFRVTVKTSTHSFHVSIKTPQLSQLKKVKLIPTCFTVQKVFEGPFHPNSNGWCFLINKHFWKRCKEQQSPRNLWMVQKY